MKGPDAKDIIDALYKTSHLEGHISARLISQNRFNPVCKAVPVLHDEPEFSDALPGGVPAVRRLWELFSRTLVHGIATLAFTLVSGGYWSARFQADTVIRSIAGFPWFQTLFTEVESGPLGQHFMHWKVAPPWNFKSAITPEAGFVYWLSLQVGLTVSRL